MSGFVAEVKTIIEKFIMDYIPQSTFNLELQGVVHMYTQYEDGIIREYYSCSFKDLNSDPDLAKINILFNSFNIDALQQVGLLIKNVSYIEFTQTAVGPGKRYQIQFSFRG